MGFTGEHTETRAAFCCFLFFFRAGIACESSTSFHRSHKVPRGGYDPESSVRKVRLVHLFDVRLAAVAVVADVELFHERLRTGRAVQTFREHVDAVEGTLREVVLVVRMKDRRVPGQADPGATEDP